MRVSTEPQMDRSAPFSSCHLADFLMNFEVLRSTQMPWGYPSRQRVLIDSRCCESVRSSVSCPHDLCFDCALRYEKRSDRNSLAVFESNVGKDEKLICGPDEARRPFGEKPGLNVVRGFTLAGSA